jgi:hypothetical protein
MDNDLNVSKAWGIIFSWVTDLNRSIDSNSLSPEAARAALDIWGQIAIRDELKAKGWTIEDTPKGPRLKPIH